MTHRNALTTSTRQSTQADARRRCDLRRDVRYVQHLTRRIKAELEGNSALPIYRRSEDRPDPNEPTDTTAPLAPVGPTWIETTPTDAKAAFGIAMDRLLDEIEREEAQAISFADAASQNAEATDAEWHRRLRSPDRP